jgi:hypothetical protein
VPVRTQPPVKPVKPPVPKYFYRLATVVSPQHANNMERALRTRLDGFGLSFFAVCHPSGSCDVMGDSGGRPMEPADLVKARAVAAQINQAS